MRVTQVADLPYADLRYRRASGMIIGMSADPVITVIISTHNRAEFLGQAIASVLSQTYPPAQIVVADDGSTDDTAARVGEFGAGVQYLRLEHSGRPSVARNRALAVAWGDLIAFLDDDDLWLPEKLEKQVAQLQADPSCGFAYCDARFLQPDGSLSPPILKPYQRRQGDILTDLLQSCFIRPSMVLVRHALLDHVGWFDETLTITEDYDLWLRLGRVAGAAFAAEPLLLVRQHGTQISVSRERQTLLNTVVVLDRVWATFDLSWRQRFYLRRLQARLHVSLGLLDGGSHEARAHFGRSLGSNPLQRRAWRELVSSYLAWRRQ